jgi:hypothetical protein
MGAYLTEKSNFGGIYRNDLDQSAELDISAARLGRQNDSQTWDGSNASREIFGRTLTVITCKSRVPFVVLLMLTYILQEDAISHPWCLVRRNKATRRVTFSSALQRDEHQVDARSRSAQKLLIDSPKYAHNVVTQQLAAEQKCLREII